MALWTGTPGDGNVNLTGGNITTTGSGTFGVLTATGAFTSLGIDDNAAGIIQTLNESGGTGKIGFASSTTGNDTGMGGTFASLGLLSSGYAALQLATSVTSDAQIAGLIVFGSSGSSSNKQGATIRSTLRGSAITNADGDLQFHTATGGTLSLRMTINEDGNVTVGKEAIDTATAGVLLRSTGVGSFTAASTIPLTINRITDDGILLNLLRDDAAAGNLTVTAGVVTLTAFCGSHWSQHESGGQPDILFGTLCSSVDALCQWFAEEWTDEKGAKHHKLYRGPRQVGETWTETVRVSRGRPIITESKTRAVESLRDNGDGTATLLRATETYQAVLYDDIPVLDEAGNPVLRPDPKTGVSTPASLRVQRRGPEVLKDVPIVHRIVQESENRLTKFAISSVAGDKRVLGVFGGWDEDGDAVLPAVGHFWVRGRGVVVGGDLLESAGDGTARKQAEDIVRASTIGKIVTDIAAEIYADGSRRVPCVLYCG